MRPGQPGPLLQAVSKGRQPGSPRLPQRTTGLVLAVVLIATAGLLLLQRDGGSGGGGAAGGYCR